MQPPMTPTGGALATLVSCAVSVRAGFVDCLRRGLQQLGADPNAACVLTTAHQLKEGSEDAMEIVKTLADIFTVMSEFFFQRRH